MPRQKRCRRWGAAALYDHSPRRLVMGAAWPPAGSRAPSPSPRVVGPLCCGFPLLWVPFVVGSRCCGFPFRSVVFCVQCCMYTCPPGLHQQGTQYARQFSTLALAMYFTYPALRSPISRRPSDPSFTDVCRGRELTVVARPPRPSPAGGTLVQGLGMDRLERFTPTVVRVFGTWCILAPGAFWHQVRALAGAPAGCGAGAREPERLAGHGPRRGPPAVPPRQRRRGAVQRQERPAARHARLCRRGGRRRRRGAGTVEGARSGGCQWPMVPGIPSRSLALACGAHTFPKGDRGCPGVVPGCPRVAPGSP
eukprot:gene3864-biopygen21846